MTDPGVDHGGDIAGSGQVAFGDGVGGDLGGVQPGEFGGAQGAPQPFRLVAWFAAVARRQVGHEQVFVPLGAGVLGLGDPDGVQDRQVVDVEQGLVPGLGGRMLLAVAAQDGGEHDQWFAGQGWRGGRGGEAGSFGCDLVVAG